MRSRIKDSGDLDKVMERGIGERKNVSQKMEKL